jgi:hypothetical protein
MCKREMKELKENEELMKENRELKAEMYRTIMKRWKLWIGKKNRNNVAYQR